MPRSDQGVSSDRYKVIPRTLIFITDRDRVLLLKGAPDKRLWANRYNGIGGHVEKGEDVLGAAQRELAEETGLGNIHLWLCGTLIVDTSENTGIGIYIFRGDYQSGELCPSKEGQLDWISAGDLGKLPLVEDLQVLLPRVLKMEIGDTPFSARSYYDKAEHLRVIFNS